MKFLLSVLVMFISVQFLTAQTPGTKKWEFQTSGSVYSSPAIGIDGTVYIGSYDHKLYAIDPTGTKKWEFETGGDIHSSPAIYSDGTVYVGSRDEKFYAINPNGTKKWEFHTGGDVESSPAIGVGGTVYVGSNDGNLYAINPDGTKKWEFKTEGSINSSPAIGTDGTVYFGSLDYGLNSVNFYAINPDGTKKWEYQTGTSTYSSPAIADDGTVYFASWNGKLYAINPDGTKKWEFQTGEEIYSSPAIGADGTIYVGSWDDKIYAVNPDGTKKWEFQTGDNVESSPTVGTDGTVYVGSFDHKLYAINPDGTKKWEFQTGHAITHSSPAIGTDGTIYVGSHDGKLYAIYSESFGLAESSWPKFCKNNNNDADHYNENCPQARVAESFIYIRNGSISLDGSPSFDPDGEPIDFLWRIIKNPLESPLILSDSTSSVINVNIPLEYLGSYRFSLTITDNNDGYSATFVSVSVGKKWEFQTEGEVRSSPAIDTDGTIFVGSYDDKVYAINPDGTKKWEFLTGSNVKSSPTIDTDGTIYVGSYDDKLYAINPDGTKKWEFQTVNWINSSPAIGSDGTIYVGSWDNKLYAFNTDGTKKWEFQTGDAVKSSPAIGADGMIYIGSWDDKLYAVNPNGTKKWEFQTGSYVDSSPAIGVDGTVYIGSWDDKLYAINPDGTKKWEFQTGGNVSSSPAIGDDGTVYLGSYDDKLYAINPNGTKKWEFRTEGDIESSPTIGTDGMVYFGSTVSASSPDYKLYALYSESFGLANSPWPKFQSNIKNTGLSNYIKADFGASPISGGIPLTVQFSDNSFGKITSWFWNFGDGDTSTIQNPVHIYNYADSFSVSLKITCNELTDTKILENYIIVFEPPIANFVADSTVGTVPFTVNFSDSSSGNISNWLWDFGDGTSSTSQNPSHTYESADTFSISLIVSGLGGADTVSRANYISVTDPTYIVSDENNIPKAYNLYPVYPNPFNPVTNIKFDIPKNNLATIKIYNVSGQLVKQLLNKNKNAGSYRITFDASGLPSGMYFIKFESHNYREIKKCLLMK